MKLADSAGRSLVSIAMLKVRYDLRHQDYLDYLRPYVEHVLPGKGERVQPDHLATKIANEFGLSVPVQVIERLLQRLQKKRLLARVDGAYYAADIAKDLGLEERRQNAAREISSVIEQFKSHCLSRFDRSVTDEESAVALTGFIQRFAVDCLRSFATSSVFPSVPSTEASDVWVASFINNAAHDNSALWQEVKTLFKSVLLANAFTCPDPDLATSKFRELTFFFDTPLILSLLGLHGEYDKRKVLELIKQIKALEGACFVFNHTLDETRAVLKYVEAHFDDADQSNRAIRQLRQDRRQRSDVVLLAASLEEDLKRLGVRARSTPAYDERYQIDESALENCLDEDIGHLNDKALLHDINSVRSIYVLRSGTTPRRLEDARAVFVTTNFKFAKAVDSFSRKYEFGREVSPVVTDFSLANICWLKRPAQADELITLELLASTEAALSPSLEEWKACLKECEKLRREGVITPEQEIFVRESLVAKDDYITLTRGAGAEFRPEVALELVRRAEERVAAPLRAAIESAESKLAEVSKKNAEQHRKQSERIARFAGGCAHLLGIAVLAAIVYGTWVGVVAAIDGSPLANLGTSSEFIAIAVPLVMAVMGWFGWGRAHLHSKTKEVIAEGLKRLLIVGPESV